MTYRDFSFIPSTFFTISKENQQRMGTPLNSRVKYNEYFMLAPVMWGWRAKNSNTQRKLPSKIAFKVVFLSQPRPGKPRSGRPTGVFLSKDAFTKLLSLYWLLYSRLTKGSNSVKGAGQGGEQIDFFGYILMAHTYFQCLWALNSNLFTSNTNFTNDLVTIQRFTNTINEQQSPIR